MFSVKKQKSAGKCFVSHLSRCLERNPVTFLAFFNLSSRVCWRDVYALILSYIYKASNSHEGLLTVSWQLMPLGYPLNSECPGCSDFATGNQSPSTHQSYLSR